MMKWGKKFIRSFGQWEITIEILNKWKHKGIGYRAISIMLDEIKNRLNLSKFRVRIDAENYPSQR